MKTITINLYEFKELPENIQKKVLDDLRDINVEDNFWNVTTIEYWNEKLTEMGFIEPTIYYSGFCSQGDGACFECSFIDIEKFISRYNSKIFNRIKRIKQHIIESCNFFISKNSHGYHYSHEKTRYVDYEYTSKKSHSIIESTINYLRDTIEEERLEMSREIYKSLKADFDYLTSDEAIIETIEANKYTFEINGTMRNE